MKACVLIAPHADDIALSVASYIRSLNVKPCIIITHSLSLDDDWKTDLTALRKSEERNFANKIGAELYFLEMPDTNYRNVKWDTFSFKLEKREVETLLNQLVSVLKAIGKELWIMVPFAIGNHPDHVACYYAGLLLACKGKLVGRISLYHDVPYAIDTGFTLKSQQHFYRLGTTHKQSFDQSEKRNDLQHYPSQLSHGYIENILLGLSHEAITHVAFTEKIKNKICTVDSLAHYDGISLI